MAPARTSAQTLTKRWQSLCDRYLPVTITDSIWRFSRNHLPGDPPQGWKLHVAATILSAADTLNAIAPLLSARSVLFKAPLSLVELAKLNTGVYYGYSQVGKFLTIYPHTTDEAVQLAEELYRLTCRFTAPSIPFDTRYRSDGSVYYRYGAFDVLTLDAGGENPVYAIRDPNGNLVADLRDSESHPAWITDPFVRDKRDTSPQPAPTPLRTTFRAFRALGQRGKGGVYQAIDLSATSPRFCVLKEGRKHGEIDWDHRDGFWRIRHEGRVLSLLRKRGIDVPQVHSSFVAGKNYFLAVEFIEGEDLRNSLKRRQRRMPLKVDYPKR